MTPTNSVKRIAMATAAAAAMVWLGGATPAEAQYYGHPGYSYQSPYRHPQPTYVHPKILRKQLEMQKRVIKKYGYQQPHYGYGYGRPVYPQPRGYGYGGGYGYDRPIYRQPGYYGQEGQVYRQPNLGNNRVRIYNGQPYTESR